jgi:ABC-type nickel/cobalt efflux system permease component RcnA
MSRFRELFYKAMPVFVVLLIANAVLWALEGLSGSYGAYLTVFFIILNLVGAWAVWSTWQGSRQKQHGASSPTKSDDQ